MMKKSSLKTASSLSFQEAAKDNEDDESSSSSDEEMEMLKKTSTEDTKKLAPTSKKKPIPNVIYIGHLPKYCEELELRQFLKQFGRLSQIRVCRSHRTGRSKGYAFVKFENPEVASIAADALNGHLIDQKKLISHVLAPDQIHRKLFATERLTKSVESVKRAKQQSLGAKSLEQMDGISKRLLDREQEKREKLKSMGIDYEFPGYEASKKRKEKEAAENDNENDAKTSDGKKSKKKRKKSFDNAATVGTPEKETTKAKKPQSEKIQKKKKDKKRRKSAP